MAFTAAYHLSKVRAVQQVAAVRLARILAAAAKRAARIKTKGGGRP